MDIRKALTNFDHAGAELGGRDLQTGRTLPAFLVDKGERIAASALFGFLKGYYREKVIYAGMPVDFWAGLGFTAAGAVASMASDGESKMAAHFERIGDAGLMSYANSMGAAYGSKQAGRTVQVLERGAALPATRSMAVVGELPAAVHGAYLTADEIARYASARV